MLTTRMCKILEANIEELGGDRGRDGPEVAGDVVRGVGDRDHWVGVQACQIMKAHCTRRSCHGRQVRGG